MSLDSREKALELAIQAQGAGPVLEEETLALARKFDLFLRGEQTAQPTAITADGVAYDPSCPPGA